MTNLLKKFEAITRKSPRISATRERADTVEIHPFDARNIHPEVSKVSQKLFDDGHYSQAIFEAFKYIDKKVSKISKIKKTGFTLMMDAFNEKNPKIKLTDLSGISESDEQKGYSFIFSGSSMAVRNPRGHEVGNFDNIEQALDYLSLASLLIKKLNSRAHP